MAMNEAKKAAAIRADVPATVRELVRAAYSLGRSADLTHGEVLARIMDTVGELEMEEFAKDRNNNL